MSNRRGGFLRDVQIGIPQKVGRFPQNSLFRDGASNTDLVGEVLAITDKGVVFLLGFKPVPPNNSN